MRPGRKRRASHSVAHSWWRSRLSPVNADRTVSRRWLKVLVLRAASAALCSPLRSSPSMSLLASRRPRSPEGHVLLQVVEPLVSTGRSGSRPLLLALERGRHQAGASKLDGGGGGGGISAREDASAVFRVRVLESERRVCAVACGPACVLAVVYASPLDISPARRRRRSALSYVRA